jgi:long-chain fatty acid transport protein
MKKRIIPGLIVVTMMFLTPLTVWATNGMNMIGTGAVSAGMGGADVAVPAGCTAIAGNPAQLATTCNRVISVGSALMFPDMEDQPAGGSNVDNEFQMFPVPFIGYASASGPAAGPQVSASSRRAAWASILRTLKLTRWPTRA